MSVTITLPPEAERQLARRAQAAGLDAPAYAQKLLLSALGRPETLEEISGPLQQQFRDSGMTDDEFGDLLEEAKHAMRRERRSGRAP
jgi:hypothetical protein